MTKSSQQTGMLPGPQILGNFPGNADYYVLPNGERGMINDNRVCFTYVIKTHYVLVSTDLDSDYGIHKCWTGAPEKALNKARRALARYGEKVNISVLLDDGWSC